MIDTCLKTAAFFYHRFYLISAMVSSTLLTFSIFSTPLILPILSTSLTLLILCSLTFGTKGCNIMGFIHLGVSSFRRQL